MTTSPTPAAAEQAALPVFVYGALRSGTTVFRLMLDGHPKIANPGEVDFLFDFLHPDATHPTGWRYDLAAMRIDFVFAAYDLTFPVTASGAPMDGLDLLEDFLRQLRATRPNATHMTLNIHRHADRIRQIFPRARFIHMLRDPRDVARSCIGMGWAAHPYQGVEPWLRTERAWEICARDIAPAQVHELTYEALFRDIETQLKAVCRFIGVAWEPAMLRYHETSTYDPPDPALVEQWRRKADPDEIALLEGKAGTMMTARGYAPTGTARIPSTFEKWRLGVRNRLFLWRFGMKRYGVTLFWGEKLSRWFGVQSLHRRIRHRQNRIGRALVR